MPNLKIKNTKDFMMLRSFFFLFIVFFLNLNTHADNYKKVIGKTVEDILSLTPATLELGARHLGQIDMSGTVMGNRPVPSMVETIDEEGHTREKPELIRIIRIDVCVSGVGETAVYFLNVYGYSEAGTIYHNYIRINNSDYFSKIWNNLMFYRVFKEVPSVEVDSAEVIARYNKRVSFSVLEYFLFDFGNNLFPVTIVKSLSREFKREELGDILQHLLELCGTASESSSRDIRELADSMKEFIISIKQNIAYFNELKSILFLNEHEYIKEEVQRLFAEISQQMRLGYALRAGSFYERIMILNSHISEKNKTQLRLTHRDRKQLAESLAREESLKRQLQLAQEEQHRSVERFKRELSLKERLLIESQKELVRVTRELQVVRESSIPKTDYEHHITTLSYRISREREQRLSERAAAMSALGRTSAERDHARTQLERVKGELAAIQTPFVSRGDRSDRVDLEEQRRCIRQNRRSFSKRVDSQASLSTRRETSSFDSLDDDVSSIETQSIHAAPMPRTAPLLVVTAPPSPIVEEGSPRNQNFLGRCLRRVRTALSSLKIAR